MSPARALGTALTELRFAARLLRRSPGFTLAVGVTLATAIGVNAAVFTLVDNILLRPLPYPRAERLALVEATYRSPQGEGSQISVDGATWMAYRNADVGFERAPFSDWTTGVNLVTATGAAHVQQQRVGAGFFRVLGVAPWIGREFSADEDRPEGAAVVVLSYRLWQQSFGGDRAVIGQTIKLRGEPYQVIGVMPESFRSSTEADLWTPLRPSTSGEGSGTNYAIVVRLPVSMEWDQAVAQSATVGGTDYQARHEPREDVSVAYGLQPLQQGLTSDLRQPLLLLWGAVALVLLIACVNIAGLVLARARRRLQEIATRSALGGGRAAIVRLLLLESVLLALLGGVLGLGVGRLALRGLLAMAAQALGVTRAVSLDARVVLATLALALLAAALFGLAPAVQASRLGSRAAIVAGGSRSVAGGSGRWPRRLLVVVEVALGAVLLVSAGLLVRTFLNLRHLEAGFDPHGLVTARASLQDVRYESASAVDRLFTDSRARIERIPGVLSATVSLGLPYERLLNLGFKMLDGVEQPKGPITNLTYVTPGYFDTLQVPLRAGRVFGAGDDADAGGVAIVNEAFVRQYFQGLEPVGRRLETAGRERVVVGVVGDVQQRPGWGDFGPLAPMPLIYVPAAQTNDDFLKLVHTWFTPAWIVRADGDATSTGALERISGELQRAVQEVDPELPVAEVASMETVVLRSLARQRFLMDLVVALGVIAALLAAVGIHALIASAVAERVRETGIRIALGATMAQAMGRLAIPGVALAAGGVVLGGVLSLLVGRLLRAFLYGVSPADPATFVAVGLGLLAVAAAASLAPTLRVLRQDPMSTLREE